MWGGVDNSEFGTGITCCNVNSAPPCIVPREGKDCNNALQCHHGPQWSR